MRVLLIGSGGREHALAWKIAQSDKLTKLFIGPGNGGTSGLGESVDFNVTDHAAVVACCQSNKIDFVVVGPEMPLVAGLADDLRAANILVFGPSKAAAQLEGSKLFTKQLCDDMEIPTSAYGHFTALAPALTYVEEMGAPIVIKADGLAAGKGVTVADTLEAALSAVKDCFEGSFGAAGAEVVIEECMVGEEVSVFAVSDGENFVTMATAQDHKRAFDGDKGPNTGGMGAYSPASIMSPKILARVEREIIAPTVAGLAKRGTPFQGVLYAGIMLTPKGPKLVEYNARFGDPETQVMMMRLKSDLLELLLASANGHLDGFILDWSEDAAITVVMAAKGYPAAYDKGTIISGANGLNTDDVQIFHAGTKLDGETLLSNGGRVLNVTALGPSVAEAHARAYKTVDAIDWPDGFCRHDIGWREVARETGK